MPTDGKALREKLDAMVEAQRSLIPHAHYFNREAALDSVALDLLKRLDAAEAAVIDLWDLLRECSDQDSSDDGVDHLVCGSDSCSNFNVLNRHIKLRRSLGPLKPSFAEWEALRCGHPVQVKEKEDSHE